MSRRWAVGLLAAGLVLTLVAPVGSAAGVVEQLVRPDGASLMITARNQLQTQAIEGFYHLMMVYTPDFGRPVTVLGGPTTVIAVSGDKVVNKAKVGPGQVGLAIPQDGYLVVGVGRGSIFLDALNVGDPVKIIEKPAVTPDPLPTMVVAENGETYAITGWNQGRGTNEMVVYTSDWGNYTYTNYWGAEALIQDGKVVYVRAIKEETPLEIPEGGIVVSGHDAAGSWIEANLQVGTAVSFQ
ncbi:MAG: hypothetical protein IMX01_07725 [Limnochordaceae bacterium]|nr:hypothetical protein [Limnochordaceae bacterium]